LSLRLFLDFEEISQLSAPSSMTTVREYPCQYGNDRPLRLAVAAKVAFPDGSMTASGLRREAKRGRLVVERIAGKDYTTLDAIQEMRRLCRVEAKGRACGSNRLERENGAEYSSTPSGSSGTGTSSGALVQARAKLRRLKGPLQLPQPKGCPEGSGSRSCFCGTRNGNSDIRRRRGPQAC
jgi:hypothetical protein